VEPIENYKIKLQYETGEVTVFDVLPYISGEWRKRQQLPF
jgi:hypothetical protein